MSGFRGKFEKELKEKLLQKSNSKLTEEACLIKMFKYFDIYDKGSVSFADFMKAMEKIGLYYNQQQLEPLFKQYDTDGSGSLDYKEFSSILFEGDGVKGQMMKTQRVNPANAKSLVEIFRKKVLQRGARGIIGLQRIFKIMDDDNSKSLCRQEFEKACKDFKAEIPSEDIGTLFQAFDINRDGTIHYDEFLRVIRGDLNDHRRSLVVKAFNKIDRDGNGVLEVSDITGVYSAKKHPAVIEGRKTEEQVLGEFLETFEQHHNIMTDNPRDYRVTLDEFIEYYTNISASIDDDMYFSSMMNSAWNLNNDAAQYKTYAKGWANDEGRPQTSGGGGGYQYKNTAPSGQPTMRSGMTSSESPFGTSQYYEGHKSPRHSIANNKHYSEQGRGQYNQITGQESANNPFTSNIQGKYSQHVSSTQKPNEYSKPLGSMAAQKQKEINVERFKQKLMKRGTKGLIGLKRQFKIMDSDGSGCLDFLEFKRALDDYRVGATEDEAKNLFSIFDKNRDGTINFQEFISAIIGDMSQFRVNIVKQAFQKLDSNGNGTLEIEEIKQKFDPSRHPDVKQGIKSVEEARSEFLDLFSTHHNVAQSFMPDKSVSLDEFIEYHQFVSATIDNDNFFKIFMTGVWNLDLVDTNNGIIKPAGVTPPVYGKNSKEQWKYDMHRSLFGQLNDSPMEHQEQAQIYQRKNQKPQQSHSSMPPAGGSSAWGSVPKSTNVQAQSDIPAYQQYPQQARPQNGEKTEKELLEEVRSKIVARGARGINGIKRVFKIMDDNNSKTLDQGEFKKALNDYRIQIEPKDFSRVFSIFDRDGNGEINYDEFLRTIVGKMNERRRNIVTLAFKRFDRDGNGYINMEDLKGRYNAANHPDVKMGKKTEEDVLYEFLDTFEQHYSLSNPSSKDRCIQLAEFIEYYNNISCSVDNDEYFEVMIRNAWNLDNKQYNKGWGSEC